MINRRQLIVGVTAFGTSSFAENYLQKTRLEEAMKPLFIVIEDSNLVISNRSEKIIPWWSFTKTVIAAAALALVRDGNLTLDEYLQGKPYTLRQLLQHRAGIADYGVLPEYHEAVAQGEKPWAKSTFFKQVNVDKLLFEPGKGWQYSNVGYRIIVDLIEQTTGQCLEKALRSLILNPLGINARLAREPSDLAEVIMGDSQNYHPGWVFHGLLVGSLQDAAFLLHRLMTGNFLPSPLLSTMRETYNLGNIPIGERPWLNPGYALGLMRGNVSGNILMEGHTGAGPSSAIAVFHAPEEENQPTVAVFYSRGNKEAQAEQYVVTMLNQRKKNL